ncbi:Pentatricopeptide repeat-containing protein [Raphanus sativus]|uniref:Pentatricopeptide repeat-containing protein At2g17670 n=1 Tax=Raphanus sativus TaxID=3726 RepID=A0A6J0KZ20_RAPSA|nr:pentatricopeptide repeat-containing protein At2g17670 [Raphanus sativus]KAJ4876878.1 Pentatricopeptide repeat-containing protein [Raphanus sativus]
MGKIPSSFRSLTSTQLIKKPPAPPPSPPPPPPRNSQNRISPKPPPHTTTTATTPSRRNPFKSPDLSSAKSLFNSIASTSKLPLDLKFHNSVLQSYASIATVDDAVNLFHHILKSHPSFSPEPSTFNILLSHACRAPDSPLSNVHRVLNLMVNSGLAPNNVTTDIAARSLCESDRIADAKDLVIEISEKHSPPDMFTYNYLLKQLCKYESLTLVYEFRDKMKESFNVKPDLVSYTIMIDHVCNSKNLREAMKLVSDLGADGFKLDCFVYNTIMKGFCTLSKGSEAVGVFKRMKEDGVEPDRITYNTLIFGLSKSGRIEEARKYLETMDEAGYEPDAVAYTALMNGMCRKGASLGALGLLEEMEARGCAPNDCTYNTLLYGLCKARLMDKGIEFYEMMRSKGLKLESYAYATLVRGLVRSGKVAEAYEVFDYAVGSKSLTDASAYATLETTLKWLKKAKEQGLAD